MKDKTWTDTCIYLIVRVNRNNNTVLAFTWDGEEHAEPQAFRYLHSLRKNGMQLENIEFYQNYSPISDDGIQSITVLVKFWILLPA